MRLLPGVIAPGADEGEVEVQAEADAEERTRLLQVFVSAGAFDTAAVPLEVTVRAIPREIDSVGGMKLVLIKAGKFRMGTPAEELKQLIAKSVSYKHEGAQHQVEITRDFYMGTTEVSVAQFRKFVEQSGHLTEAEKAGDIPTWKNSYSSTGSDQPVVCVSWNDADAFCKWLSREESKTYELPTEAEWEYACRAGTTTAYHFGDACNGKEANCDGNSPHGTNDNGPYLQKTSPVKSYAANRWGLYDMHGNVWEWCQDDKRDFQKGDNKDPKCSLTSSNRVLRGGSCYDEAISCRAAYRNYNARDDRFSVVGFRVVCRLSSRAP